MPFKGWGINGTDMVFAKTFQVGWNIAQPVHHYRVTLDKLTWLSELDGPQTGQCNPQLPCTGNPQSSSPPDELNFYAEVAGQWRQLQAPPAVNGQYNLTSGTEVPLADTFDLDSLRELLAAIRARSVRVVTVDTDRASPFAASLLFEPWTIQTSEVG